MQPIFETFRYIKSLATSNQRKSFDLKDQIINGYVFSQKLGEGSFGTVYKANKSQSIVAIKVMDKNEFKNEMKNTNNQKYVDTQIEILQKMNHKNVIKFYEQFQEDQMIFIVTQYCNKGNLLQHRNKYPNQRIPQKEALKLFQQILDGFQHISSKKILHRDLKLANILLHQKKQNQVILKIADFGLGSKLSSSKRKAKSCVGTPTIRAPQVCKGQQYGSEADIWSLGVLLYEMLFGKPPFNGINQFIYNQINTKSPNYQDAKNFKISEEAVDFIKRCLVVDKEKRITQQQMFQHDLILKNSFFIKLLMKFSLKIVQDNKHQQQESQFLMNQIYINHQRDNRMFGIKNVLQVKIKHPKIQKEKHFNVLYEIAKKCYIEIRNLRSQIQSENLCYKYKFWQQFKQTKNYKDVCQQLLQDQMQAESLAVCFKEELKSINPSKYSNFNVNRQTNAQKYKKTIKQYRSIMTQYKPRQNKQRFAKMLIALQILENGSPYDNQAFIRRTQNLKLS